MIAAEVTDLPFDAALFMSALAPGPAVERLDAPVRTEHRPAVRLHPAPVEAQHPLDCGPQVVVADVSTRSGIGLATCRRLATARGGTLRLEETPGGGTTAALNLPTGTAPN